MLIQRIEEAIEKIAKKKESHTVRNAAIVAGALLGGHLAGSHIGWNLAKMKHAKKLARESKPVLGTN